MVCKTMALFLRIKFEWRKIKYDKLVQQTGHTRSGPLPFAIACFESIENRSSMIWTFCLFWLIRNGTKSTVPQPEESGFQESDYEAARNPEQTHHQKTLWA